MVYYGLLLFKPHIYNWGFDFPFNKLWDVGIRDDCDDSDSQCAIIRLSSPSSQNHWMAQSVLRVGVRVYTRKKMDGDSAEVWQKNTGEIGMNWDVVPNLDWWLFFAPKCLGSAAWPSACFPASWSFWLRPAQWHPIWRPQRHGKIMKKESLWKMIELPSSKFTIRPCHALGFPLNKNHCSGSNTSFTGFKPYDAL